MALEDTDMVSGWIMDNVWEDVPFGVHMLGGPFTVAATAAPICRTLKMAVHPHSKVTFAERDVAENSSANALRYRIRL